MRVLLHVSCADALLFLASMLQVIPVIYVFKQDPAKEVAMLVTAGHNGLQILYLALTIQFMEILWFVVL